MDFPDFSIPKDKQAGNFQPGSRTAQLSEEHASVGEMVASAMGTPLDFPDLAMSIVPGDRLTISVLGRVAQLPEVLQAVLDYLEQLGVRRENISLLFDRESYRWLIKESQPNGTCETTESIENSLAETNGAVQSETLATTQLSSPFQDLSWKVHDPDDTHQLAYLAADPEGEPIVFSRELVEADFVIAISDAGLLSDSDRTLAGELFPAFSDRAAIERLIGSGNEPPEVVAEEVRLRRVEEAIYQLGFPFYMEVVAGSDGEAAAVFCGRHDSTRDKAREQNRLNWIFEIPYQADLVIAEPKSNQHASNWSEIEATIRRLEKAVVDQGTLVLRAELLGKDEESPDEEEASEEIGDSMHPADLVPTHAETEQRPELELEYDPVEDRFRNQEEESSETVHNQTVPTLAAILERIHIVLLGKSFDDDRFESLGFGVASSDAAVARLASQHDRCLLVHDGIRCQINLNTEFVNDENIG